jgi:hypothetical protein
MAVIEDVNCVNLLWPYSATFPKAPILLRQYNDITKDWIKQLRECRQDSADNFNKYSVCTLPTLPESNIDQETCSIAI